MIQVKEVTNTTNNEEFISKKHLRRCFVNRLNTLVDNLMEDIKHDRNSIASNAMIEIFTCIIDANMFGIISDNEYEDIEKEFDLCCSQPNKAYRLTTLTIFKDYVTEKGGQI